MSVAAVVAADTKQCVLEEHSERVALYSSLLAMTLGLDLNEVVSIRKMAFLHDIGKEEIPAEILFKKGKLNQDEFEIIKKHPVLGAGILSKAYPHSFVKGVLYHHERYNGSGYPMGFRGASIPREARILAIADAFDAMTSERPYKESLSVREALDELERCIGSQFAPEEGRAFIKLMEIIYC